MLNSDDNYSNNNTDFDEINSTIEQIGVNKKNNPKNEEKLPFNTKMAMFLLGFSYAGLLGISLIVSLFVLIFTKDEGLSNIIVQSVSYVILLGAFIYVCYPYKKFFLKNLQEPTNYLYGFLFGLMTIGCEIIVSYLVGLIYQADTNANQAVVESLVNSYPTLMFIVTVFIGPICEELTYRVGLFGMLKEKNETMAFIVSALVFAFVHISFFDTTVAAELTAFPVYLTIGFLLTYAYKRYGLACSLVAHMMLNLLSFIAIILHL